MYFHLNLYTKQKLKTEQNWPAYRRGKDFVINEFKLKDSKAKKLYLVCLVMLKVTLLR